ncbi:mitochondrial assembly of ribosomal large subunit protein 1 [Clarias gariepinus]|uniref:mitochondrial assembly of ribosomal large subunit protein 1 n=1 Tax=Clarias gariepinus TaxID=13013 RepID=UPI00234DA801|nr:mitochondrial assembly of ribosomal large subunit protein 1 [Clarias gariepinus]
MAALGCGRCVLTRVFNRSVCYRAAAGLHTLTHTLSHTHRRARAVSPPVWAPAGGSVGLSARDSYTLPQHGGAVFKLDVLVSLLREENAVDVCVIRVPAELKYTEYFIIASGTSTRHIRAMAQYTVKVYKFLRRDSDPHTHIEGQDCEDWMCVDFGSMVVHFMLPETREKFQLETLWTLRNYEQLTNNTLAHTLPPDFILTHSHTHIHTK